MAADQYTIYIVNESSSTQIFWCFLERPQELASDPKVFANSNTNLQIASRQPGINSFTIPVQYIVAAGASNNAVAPNILVQSSVTNNANLGDQWETFYASVPPNAGPTMTRYGTSGPSQSIQMASSPFEKEKNEAYGWYSNMTFGIRTSQGFMGMTWSPDPNQQRTLTPKLSFYVTIGNYDSNSLADFTTVSRSAAEISVPSSFDILNQTTVTYTSSGTWIVTPGKPKSSTAMLAASNSIDSLIQIEHYLSKAHADLIDSVKLSLSNPVLSSSSSQEDCEAKI